MEKLEEQKQAVPEPAKDSAFMAVGEIREYEGKKYQCVRYEGQAGDCEGCAFNSPECGQPLGDCWCGHRGDKEDVIFKEVEL